MNVKQLRDESERLRLDAQTKRKQADRFTFNANDYDKADDPVKAGIERMEAAKLIEEAVTAEQKADELDQDAATQEARALEIDKRQADLQAEHDRQMKALESEKARLRGGVGLFS